MSGDAIDRAGDVADRRRLFTTFGQLVARQGATAVIGLGYWSLVTHLFEARNVGVAAAATSVTAFLAAIGALGIPLLLLAEFKRVEEARRRAALTTGIAISCGALLLLSVGTLALAPVFGKSLRIIAGDPAVAALFVAGALVTVTANTFDNAAIGLHRGSAQVLRATLASILKVACVGIFVLIGIRSIFALVSSWVAGLAVSLLVCAPLLRLGPRRRGEGARRKRMALVRQYGVLSLNHHVLNLSINSVSYTVPALATLIILPRQVAYFVTASLLESTVMIVPYLMALALFAERPDDPDLLHRHLRRTLPLSFAMCGAIIIGAELTAPVVLQFFGPLYAAHASSVLRLLVFVGPSYVVKDHYVAIKRARGHLASAAKVVAVGTAAETGAAALGGIYLGGMGLALGWVIGAACVAAALSPPVLQAYREGSQHRLQTRWLSAKSATSEQHA